MIYIAIVINGAIVRDGDKSTMTWRTFVGIASAPGTDVFRKDIVVQLTN